MRRMRATSQGCLSFLLLALAFQGITPDVNDLASLSLSRIIEASLEASTSQNSPVSLELLPRQAEKDAGSEEVCVPGPSHSDLIVRKVQENRIPVPISTRISRFTSLPRLLPSLWAVEIHQARLDSGVFPSRLIC